MQFGFAGEVVAASCKCHAGKWMVGVFLVVPGAPRQFLANVTYDTQELANNNIDHAVKTVADEFLAQAGLSADQAERVSINHGEAATLAERRMQNQANPNLH